MIDKDKLIQRLAMQVAEYNLSNVQLALRIEALEAETEELTGKLWDALPDTSESIAKTNSKKSADAKA